jgi:hypothetical protein
MGKGTVLAFWSGGFEGLSHRALRTLRLSKGTVKEFCPSAKLPKGQMAKRALQSSSRICWKADEAIFNS